MIPPENAWLRRSNNDIIIGCYSSQQTWQLHCDGREWKGLVGTCPELCKTNIIKSVFFSPTNFLPKNLRYFCIPLYTVLLTVWTDVSLKRCMFVLKKVHSSDGRHDRRSASFSVTKCATLINGWSPWSLWRILWLQHVIELWHLHVITATPTIVGEAFIFYLWIFSVSYTHLTLPTIYSV